MKKIRLDIETGRIDCFLGIRTHNSFI